MADRKLRGGAKILGPDAPARRRKPGPYSLHPAEPEPTPEESFATRRSNVHGAVEKKIGHLREAGTLVTAIRTIARSRNEAIERARNDRRLTQEGVRDAIRTAETKSMEAYQKEVLDAFRERHEVAKRQAGEAFKETTVTAGTPETQAQRLDLLLEGQTFPLMSSVDQLTELERLAETGDHLRLRHLLKVFEAKNDGDVDAGRVDRLRSLLVTDAELAQRHVGETFDRLAFGLETYADVVFTHGADDPQADVRTKRSIGRQGLDAGGFTFAADTE